MFSRFSKKNPEAIIIVMIPDKLDDLLGVKRAEVINISKGLAGFSVVAVR